MTNFGDYLFGDGIFGDSSPTSTTPSPGSSPLGIDPQNFTIISANLFTDEVIDEIPHRNLRFETKYKKPGDMSFLVELGDDETRKKQILQATRPAQVALYVDYNGTLVWGGPLWVRGYGGASNTLSINAKEWMSYWYRRNIVSTLRFRNVDQLSIFRGLINHATTQFGGDVGLGVDNSLLSGVLRKRTYFGHELKNIGEALFQLSEVINGFEYRFPVEWVGDKATKRLSLGYPQLGSRFPGNDLLFDFPGNIADYTHTEDGDDFLTRTWAIGKGEGPNMLRISSTSPDVFGGYPLLEDIYSYKDISRISTLQEHAETDLAFRNLLTKSFPIQVGFSNPKFGTYTTGDYCQVQITDDRFPRKPDGAPGLTFNARIMNITASVTEGAVTLEIGNVWER